MALGYLNINYTSVVLDYDDEMTPTKLIGKKMLPIFEFDDGKVMPESLDIIAQLDTQNRLNQKFYFDNKQLLDSWLNELSGPIHSLAMPYWIWTFEFNESSRNYFQKKKEEKRGPFKELLKKSESFKKDLNPLLLKLEIELQPYFHGTEMTLSDIVIASHLWGLFVVPEFQFSPKIYDYLMKIKENCRFEYHQDLLN